MLSMGSAKEPESLEGPGIQWLVHCSVPLQAVK